MPVVLVRDAVNRRLLPGLAGKRMYLYAEGGVISLSVEFAPRVIDYDGYAADWVTAERVGDKPLLVRKGRRLRTMSFSFLMASKSEMHFNADPEFNALRGLCDTNERVLVRYGPQEAGLWRVTEASISSELRHPQTNAVSRATVSVTLTEASDAAPAVGPVTGGAKPPAAPSKAPAPRTYKVVKGDCLWNIAKRFYGNGPLWPRIYDANRKLIRDPHWIYPGQVFVIP